MFSLLDAVVDRPIEQALEFLPMEEDVKAALLGEDNPVRRFLDYVMAYEAGDWDALAEQGAGVVPPEIESPELYLEAVQYAVRSFEAASGSRVAEWSAARHPPRAAAVEPACGGKGRWAKSQNAEGKAAIPSKI